MSTPPGMTEPDLDDLLSGCEHFDDLPPLCGSDGGLLLTRCDMTDDQQGDDDGITASFLGRCERPCQAPTCTAELCNIPCWRQEQHCGPHVCLDCDELTGFVAHEPLDVASDSPSAQSEEPRATGAQVLINWARVQSSGSSMHRPRCQCRCRPGALPCLRQPRRVIVCPRCQARVGPGCCWRRAVGMCHMCNMAVLLTPAVQAVSDPAPPQQPLQAVELGEMDGVGI